MSIPKNELQEVSKKQSTSQQKRILVSCDVSKYGVGGFYHLLDLLESENTFMRNYRKDVFLVTEHRLAQRKIFEKSLKNKGFEVIIVEDDSPGEFLMALDLISRGEDKRIAFILDPIDSVVNIIIEKINNYYAGKISISTDIFYRLGGEKRFVIPNLWIMDHAGADTEGLTDRLTKIPMNLLGGTKSIFLSKEDRANPAQQLAEVLLKPENHAIKIALLEQDHKEGSEIEKICENFLQNNLFVPAYLQHSSVAIVNFMNIVIQSELSDKYQSVVFFVNAVDEDTLRRANDAQMFSRNIKQIVLKDKKGERIFKNKNANSSAKVITLVAGYRIQEDYDYKKLFHCAQYFAGCSGDKTFENVLSNGLIPLFIHSNLGNFGETNFIQDAATFDSHFKAIVFLDELTELFHLMLTIPEVEDLKIIKERFLNMKVSEGELPEVIKKWKTGRAFTIGEKTYCLDYPEEEKMHMAKFFVKKLFKVTGKEYKSSEGYKSYKEIATSFISKANDNEGFQSFLSDLLLKFKVEDKDSKGLTELANRIASALRSPEQIKIGDDLYSPELDEKQKQELCTLFLEELKEYYLKLMSEKIKSKNKELSLLFNRTFFEEWQALCQKLMQDYNLHKKVPSIINNFFKEKGLKIEMSDDIGDVKEKREVRVIKDKDKDNDDSMPPLTFTKFDSSSIQTKEKIAIVTKELTSFSITTSSSSSAKKRKHL